MWRKERDCGTSGTDVTSETLRHCLRVAETFGKDEIVSTTRRAYLGRLGRLDCHEQAICRKETGDKEVEREEIARAQSNLPDFRRFGTGKGEKTRKIGRLDLLFFIYYIISIYLYHYIRL